MRRRTHAGGHRGFISIYDIQSAVAYKATVPNLFEICIFTSSLNADGLPKLDVDFEEITQG